MFIIALLILCFFPMALFVVDQVVEFFRSNSKEAKRIQAIVDARYAAKSNYKFNFK